METTATSPNDVQISDAPLRFVTDGWFVLILLLMLFALDIAFGYHYGTSSRVIETYYSIRTDTEWNAGVLTAAGLSGFVLLVMSFGLFILEPNEGLVCTFFGSYRGAYRKSGFWWTNPFYSFQKISLRQTNLETQSVKVNDRKGNPVEVSAIIAWRVLSPGKAIFCVEDYANYLRKQAETALRQVVGRYAYEQSADDEHSLLASMDHVADSLRAELQEQMAIAGIEVVDARISHIAYAPEIAQAMLRRQQADAVVAARQSLVMGAVGIVQATLEKLESEEVAAFGAAERARFVSNLLVVLAGETSAQPVITVGRES